MSNFQVIKEAIDRQQEAWDAYVKTNDARYSALKSGHESRAAELDEQLKRIEVDLSAANKAKKDAYADIELMRERIEDLEARSKMPGRPAMQKFHDEHKKLFVSWLRNRGQSPSDEAKLHELQMKAPSEFKDVTIGTTSAGGFAVPEEISRDIERLEKKFSPVRDLVKVVRAGTSDYKELVNIHASTGGWVGETGTRSATATSLLRERAPTHGELYAYPQASEWSLDDIFFDVEAWVAGEVAEAFAIAEANSALTGNGTNQLTGMLNTAPVSTADYASPLRAAAAYQFVSTDLTPGGVGILADDLFTLVYTLNSRYRVNATWAMNSLTISAVRKLKDTTNQYLWQPGLQAGQPDRLLGYPLSTWEQMADVGANNHPIAFGDFRRGYVIADRVGLRITRDNVTNIGFVRFYIRRREGGTVLNNDAIKWLKTL